MQIYQQVVTIAAGGTPQAIPNPSGSALGVFAKVMFLPAHGNAAISYVGISTLNSGTQAGVLFILPIRAANAPSAEGVNLFRIEDGNNSNTIDLSQFRLDGATNEKIIVVCFQA